MILDKRMIDKLRRGNTRPRSLRRAVNEYDELRDKIARRESIDPSIVTITQIAEEIAGKGADVETIEEIRERIFRKYSDILKINVSKDQPIGDDGALLEESLGDPRVTRDAEDLLVEQIESSSSLVLLKKSYFLRGLSLK